MEDDNNNILMFADVVNTSQDQSTNQRQTL